MDDAAGEVLGFGAGGGFQMVRNTAGRDKGSLAEWTFDRSALMDATSHVLGQVVGILEVTITVGTVEVLVVAFFLLVLIVIILETEGIVASLAVVMISKVTLSLHVLLCGSLGAKTRIARFTLVRPSPVARIVHMLDTTAPRVEAASARITLVAAHVVQA